MNKILVSTLLLLTILTALQAKNQGHLLSHFESEVKNMVHAYQGKETSKAFSIAMKVFNSI
jgi:hypothetical protein